MTLHPRCGAALGKTIALAASLLVSASATLWAFWPGLTGPFLFDDFPNLSPLGLFGGVHDFNSALKFIFGGNAGPTGRPLSLATFLLNDDTWPSEPFAFKYTNLLLHLLTGITLFAFLRQIRPAPLSTQHPASREWIALFGASLWLLHPIQAAPIFLVIQRMTILSALFCLTAMAVWMAGRNRLIDGRPHAWLLMSSSVVVGGVLAVLSKENGILLPSLVLVLERTLAPLPPSRKASNWRLLFLILPSAIIIAYFIFGWHGIVAGYAGRDFTLQERLLTEPLVLLDYLKQIFLPSITTTIFRDDFPVATGFTLRTLVAIAFWISALGFSIWARKRHPALAFAILFFVVGQILESGPIALELYFIHRNYLPMVGLLFAAAYYLVGGLKRVPAAAAGLALGTLVILGVTARAESIYWGREDLLVNAWANERPASPRAAAMAANFWGQRGYYGKAIDIIERTLALHPNSPSLMVGNYYEHCLTHTERREHWDQFLALIPQASRDNALLDALSVLATNIRDSACTKVNIKDIIEALDQLKSSPRYSDALDQGQINYNLALYFLEVGEPPAAVGALENAVKVSPTAYEYELLGDLYREGGHRELAIKSYRSALAIPYFKGWRAWLLGEDRPKFETLRTKLKTLEETDHQPDPVSP